MSLNTFIDYSSSSMMSAQEAELYMRIYQYAAEDFRAVTDCTTAHNNVTSYTTNLATQLMSVVNTHTHTGNFGAPTSPPMSPVTPPPAPVVPMSTTGVAENKSGNNVVGSSKVSYIDTRISGSINTIVTYLRRGKPIPIANALNIHVGTRQ